MSVIPDISYNTTNVSIDLIKSLDFTKGFSYWQINWPLENALGSSISNQFILGDQFTPSTGWRIRIVPGKYGTISFELAAVNVSAPVFAIVRFVVHKVGADLLLNTTHLRLIDGKFNPSSIRLSIDKRTYRSLVGDGVGVHICCLIDILRFDVAKAIEEVAERDRPMEVDGFVAEARNTMASNFAEMFKAVLGEDSEMASLSDITLTVLNENGSTRQFYCHRNVLAGRSDLFRCILVNMHKREEMKGTDILEIRDMEEEDMKLLLDHIYTGRLPGIEYDQDICPISSLLYGAIKYNLPVLKEWCEVKLIQFLSLDCSDSQILGVSLLAERYQLDQAMKLCATALCPNMEILEPVVINAAGDQSSDLLPIFVEAMQCRINNTTVIDIGLDNQTVPEKAW